MREDFESTKIPIMYALLKQKFSNVYLAAKLYETDNMTLIEGNKWGDKFWGCVWENNSWVGENNLGKLLMKIRSELRW
jgi:predicted NAD-dependent protein-ADP-ribosyltransferase YbiA (DUF1768 family)